MRGVAVYNAAPLRYTKLYVYTNTPYDRPPPTPIYTLGTTAQTNGPSRLHKFHHRMELWTQLRFQITKLFFLFLLVYFHTSTSLEFTLPAPFHSIQTDFPRKSINLIWILNFGQRMRQNTTYRIMRRKARVKKIRDTAYFRRIPWRFVVKYGMFYCKYIF